VLGREFEVSLGNLAILLALTLLRYALAAYQPPSSLL
jgi:hypothetical protein